MSYFSLSLKKSKTSLSVTLIKLTQNRCLVRVPGRERIMRHVFLFKKVRTGTCRHLTYGFVTRFYFTTLSFSFPSVFENFIKGNWIDGSIIQPLCPSEVSPPLLTRPRTSGLNLKRSVSLTFLSGFFPLLRISVLPRLVAYRPPLYTSRCSPLIHSIVRQIWNKRSVTPRGVSKSSFLNFTTLDKLTSVFSPTWPLLLLISV